MDGSEEMAADDAFALLGNETRIQILKAVWRRTRSEGIERNGPVSFSTLQAAVGAPDSGNFSYHLDQLVGPFIARVDGGYVIRRAGSHIVRAILAGSVTEEASFGPVVVDETCYRCDSPIAVSYDDDRLYTRCTECDGAVDADGGAITALPMPPAGLAGRTPEGLVRSTCISYFAELGMLRADVCPVCAGRIDLDLEVCTEHAVPEDGLCSTCRTEPGTIGEAVCRTCRLYRVFVPMFAAHSHPAIAETLAARGYNPAAPGYRELCEMLRWPVEPSADSVAYTVPTPDGERTVRIDGTLLVNVH